jgi:hypothetical protein
VATVRTLLVSVFWKLVELLCVYSVAFRIRQPHEWFFFSRLKVFLILIVRSHGILSFSFDTSANYMQVHWVWIQYPQSALCRPDVTSILESSVESLASYLTLVHSLIVSLFFTFKHASEECQDVNVISLKTNAWRTDVDQMWRPFLRAQLKV